MAQPNILLYTGMQMSNTSPSDHMNRDQRIQKAAGLLQLSREEATTNSREIEGDATYVWQDRRGGGAVLVASDGSVLFANSSVSPDVHEREFAAGRRTDESLFEQS